MSVKYSLAHIAFKTLYAPPGRSGGRILTSVRDHQNLLFIPYRGSFQGTNLPRHEVQHQVSRLRMNGAIRLLLQNTVMACTENFFFTFALLLHNSTFVLILGTLNPHRLLSTVIILSSLWVRHICWYLSKQHLVLCLSVTSTANARAGWHTLAGRTVIPRLPKIIRSGISFVSRNLR